MALYLYPQRTKNIIIQVKQVKHINQPAMITRRGDEQLQGGGYMSVFHH